MPRLRGVIRVSRRLGVAVLGISVLFAMMLPGQALSAALGGPFQPGSNAASNAPAPQVLSTSVMTAKKATTVYVTKTGKKYHRSGCRYLKQSKIAIKLPTAKKRGYQPCKICKPPR